ncbi:hypothetical protein BDZ89DRAFT_1081372 [Hymenopellis radicata]|nr:hypothetical protein BDZ89DRAFT_1081372 [Hymenopellis radicata]
MRIVHVANPCAIARGSSACTKCPSNLSVPHGCTPATRFVPVWKITGNLYPSIG